MLQIHSYKYIRGILSQTDGASVAIKLECLVQSSSEGVPLLDKAIVWYHPCRNKHSPVIVLKL